MAEGECSKDVKTVTVLKEKGQACVLKVISFLCDGWTDGVIINPLLFMGVNNWFGKDGRQDM